MLSYLNSFKINSFITMCKAYGHEKQYTKDCKISCTIKINDLGFELKYLIQ